jgi:hypothetical protein
MVKNWHDYVYQRQDKPWWVKALERKNNGTNPNKGKS